MNTILAQRVLVLNRLWQAVNVCTVRRAVSLLCSGHAQVVDGGAFAGRPWHRQPDWITGDRPLKLYRPEGR